MDQEENSSMLHQKSNSLTKNKTGQSTGIIYPTTSVDQLDTRTDHGNSSADSKSPRDKKAKILKMSSKMKKNNKVAADTDFVEGQSKNTEMDSLSSSR